MRRVRAPRGSASAIRAARAALRELYDVACGRSRFFCAIWRTCCVFRASAVFSTQARDRVRDCVGGGPVGCCAAAFVPVRLLVSSFSLIVCLRFFLVDSAPVSKGHGYPMGTPWVLDGNPWDVRLWGALPWGPDEWAPYLERVSEPEAPCCGPDGDPLGIRWGPLGHVSEPEAPCYGPDGYPWGTPWVSEPEAPYCGPDGYPLGTRWGSLGYPNRNRPALDPMATPWVPLWDPLGTSRENPPLPLKPAPVSRPAAFFVLLGRQIPTCFPLFFAFFFVVPENLPLYIFFLI